MCAAPLFGYFKYRKERDFGLLPLNFDKILISCEMDLLLIVVTQQLEEFSKTYKRNLRKPPKTGKNVNLDSLSISKKNIK